MRLGRATTEMTRHYASVSRVALIVAVVAKLNITFIVIESCLTQFQAIMADLDEATERPGKERDRVIKR